MKAAVVEEIAKPLVVHTHWPDPDCGPDDAVVEVQANGICLSDHHLWQGGWPWMGIATQTPMVLGHEFCGVVEEVGAKITRFEKGDRVAIPFNHSCGRCEQCQAGHQNVCLDLRLPMLHYTGGFGRYAKVTHADVNLVPLPPSISYLEAGAMGCRFMTSWHGVVDQANVVLASGWRFSVVAARTRGCRNCSGSGSQCHRSLPHACQTRDGQAARSRRRRERGRFTCCRADHRNDRRRGTCFGGRAR